jgi:uncharacterized protein (DUF433 family)/DNA-binding transcriptional MerR regulator
LNSYRDGVASDAVQLPRGRYLADEVGRLAGVSGHEIGQWKHHGYIRASRASGGYPLVYSYQDVAEAMLVHALRERGIEYGAIRRAIAELRDEFGAWPLSAAKGALRVPAARPDRAGHSSTIVLRRDGHSHDIGAPFATEVLTDKDLVQVASDLERGGWAARQLPKLRHIEVNPNRLSGQPVVRGKRVPATDAGRLAQTDEGRKLLRSDYALSRAEIDDVRDWWREVSSYEAA